MQETTLIEQEQPVGSLNDPDSRARSDDDAVLLRSKANPGSTGPRGNARGDSNPQTHSAYHSGGQTD